MPRPQKIPAYKLHKPSGRARVIIDGRHIYLGKFGSPESHELYARLIADYLRRKPAQRPAIASATLQLGTLTISQLILAYWTFAKTYYVLDGHPTKELSGMKDSLRPLRELFGRTLANEFGPKSLAIVRQHMISQQGLARTETNKRIGRIKRVFKWAVAEELIESSVYHGLQALTGLRFGRTEARETEPIKPVADKDVDAILPFLAPQILRHAETAAADRHASLRSGPHARLRHRSLGRRLGLRAADPQKPVARASQVDCTGTAGAKSPAVLSRPRCRSFSF